jgi:ABC-type Mn2+/Zn2+ transport system permease subunit
MRAILEQAFFQHALIAGTLVAFTCSVVGVYVLLKRVVFLGIALAQIASAGVALALLLHWNPLLTALAASLAGVVAFSQTRWRWRVPIEGFLGAAYVLAGALAIVFLAKNPVGEARALTVLFGNILSVPGAEMAALAAVSAVVALIHLLFRKEFVFVSFDFETAAAQGVKARFWDLLLYVTLGVVIAFAIRSVGVLVTFALLVLPAMGARLLVSGIAGMFVAAVGLGTLSIPVGLATAFAYDLPTGATICLTVAALFAAALVARALGRVGRRRFAAAVVAGAALLAAPAAAFAQTPAAVEAELKALREAVRELRGTVTEQQRMIEELRSGRAAPAPAAPPAPPTPAAPTGQVAPEAEPGARVDLSLPERRGLPPYLALLPEIRVEGNLIGNYTFGNRRKLERQLGEETAGEDFFARRNRLDLHEVEVGFRSTIDPFARFEAIISAESVFGGELEVGLEEGILTLTALPGRIQSKIGKFRTGFGEFNDADPEEIPEVDPPNVIRNVFGAEGDGWIDTGIAVTRLFGVTDNLSFTLWGAVFNGDNEEAFHGGRAGVARRPAWFVRLESFLELGPLSGFEWSVGYAQGYTRDELGRANLRSRIINAHVEWDYRPPILALYRGFNFLTEVFYTLRDHRFEEEIEIEDPVTGEEIELERIRFDTVGRLGLYSIAEAQISRNWSIGGRFDYSQLPEREERGPSVRWETAGSAIVSYRPSRFLTLRAQYKHTERNFALDSDEIYLQALFIIGYERPGLF